jgi:thiosulfate reductase cytochrome b subunit
LGQTNRVGLSSQPSRRLNGCGNGLDVPKSRRISGRLKLSRLTLRNCANKEGFHMALIYRQRLATRITHWVWAICLFFLLFSGLQIFNAHPMLHWGWEAGFEYDNALAAFEVPGALTMPSGRSLATGRVIHFFFAWGLVITLTVWAVASLWNGHLRALIPTGADLRALPQDIADHARLRFHHTARYNVLQKLAYAGVLFVALPLMIATGLTMSPGFNAIAPWLLDVFGGRQSARTIHFAVMLALVGFFAVHMLMILAAGPLNEIRSIITGWYRTDGGEDDHAA